MEYKGYQIASLLDSGIDVTLIWQSYFDENLMHLVRAHSGEKSEAHTLFNLTVANDDQLPITKYVELDLNFMGTHGTRSWECWSQEIQTSPWTQNIGQDYQK